MKLREGYVFSRVCLSVHGGRYPYDHYPWCIGPHYTCNLQTLDLTVQRLPPAASGHWTSQYRDPTPPHPPWTLDLMYHDPLLVTSGPLRPVQTCSFDGPLPCTNSMCSWQTGYTHPTGIPSCFFIKHGTRVLGRFIFYLCFFFWELSIVELPA